MSPEESSKLQNYLDIVGSLIGIVDREQRITFANKKTCEVSGYDAGDLLGKNYFDILLPAQIKENIRAGYVMYMAGELEPPEFFENQLLTKNGEERIIYWHDVILRDDNDNIIGTISSGEDITERKLAEEKLSKAYEELKSLDIMKNEFLSNVSHEFKTPLISIMGYSELMSDGTLGVLNEQQTKAMEAVVRNSERLKRLINSLLDLSIVQDERAKYRFDPLQINEIIDSAILDISAQVEKKQIIIEKNIPANLPLINGDKDHLIQLIINFIDNAVKFTPSGGLITITVREEENDIHIMVSDNGIGIPKEAISDVFKLFYQIDGSMKRRYQGTGVGLYLCEKIVEAHKGCIWVDSTEGVGTTIHVSLPCQSA